MGISGLMPGDVERFAKEVMRQSGTGELTAFRPGVDSRKKQEIVADASVEKSVQANDFARRCADGAVNYLLSLFAEGKETVNAAIAC